MTSTTAAPAAAAETWNLLRDVLTNLDTLDPEGSDALQALVQSSGVRAGALRVLRQVPLHGPISMQDLIRALQCDKAYATVTVNELEKHQYVTRTVDPVNRRAKLIEVTPAGREVGRRARLLHEQPPKALAQLPVGDLQALQRLLRRLASGKPQPASSPALDERGRDRAGSSRSLRALRRSRRDAPSAD